MKKLKFLLPIILTLTVIMMIFVVSQIPAKAAETSGTCGDNLTWSFDEATGTLTISGTGDMTDYSYDSYSSAPWKSKWASIKTAKISEGVTSIGDHAFDGCKNLTSITIPDGVTSIGDSAFMDCYRITDITIPDSVTTIGDHAFQLCQSLTSITVPDSVTNIDDYAFIGCENLTSVTIGKGVTSIGRTAFYYCISLISITIPDSVTSIGDSAFQSCANLKNITIGNGVTSIGENTFNGCSNLKTVYVSSSNIVENLTSSTSCGKLIYHADTVYIENSITYIPSYVTSSYRHKATVVYDEITYTKYSKNTSHNFDTDWRSDKNNHWHECSCGEKSELVPHSWNNGEITLEPTVDFEGEMTFTCTACSATRTEKLDKLEAPDEPDTPDTPEEPEEKKNDSVTIIIISAIIVVAIIGVCVVIIIKKKKA